MRLRIARRLPPGSTSTAPARFLGYVTGLTGEPLADRPRSRIAFGSVPFVLGFTGVFVLGSISSPRPAAHSSSSAPGPEERGARQPRPRGASVSLVGDAEEDQPP